MSLAPLALLQAAAAAPADGPPALLQFLPLIAMGFAMWFLFLRPQMRQQKEHRAKIDGLKKGDQVLTGGGLIGKVLKVDDHYADIELGQNVRVRALKSTITDIIPPGGTAAAND
ncbi:MAG: preprotein translocase subunit YajC [Proteobacteria bacterium]|nr:preprotein translocase subunit YajC [Pseudomonadota bacterium]